MEQLARVALALRGKRVVIWALTAVGLFCGAWGQLAALRGEVERSIGVTYVGFLVAACGGALHSIAFWFAPGKNGRRSRFERLWWVARPYPFLEVFLSLMWLLALLMNAWTILRR